jgi:hypothetical protein
MIRIAISDDALLEAIRKKSPKWLARALEVSKRARKAGKIGDQDGIWSEIKEVYILLQEFKCVYCEFPLPKIESISARGVAVDYDVEHYRPKNRVTPWPTPEVLSRRPSASEYAASVVPGAPAGYLRLAFDPFNYVVSCKVCNTYYKADRFPIAGKPDSRSIKRTSLDAREMPLLLFPFGENGDDPGLYLLFEGAMIRPRPAAGLDGLRARAVVDFFELDTREDLLEGRCLLIQSLWAKLEERTSGDAEEKAEAAEFLEVLATGNRFMHSACGRAYVDLYERDREQARRWYRAANQYLASKAPDILKALS